MIALDSVLSRLDGLRRMRRGWSARCPAHEDRTPSLSLLPLLGGRIALRCWAGCSRAAVLAVLGLEDDGPAGPSARARQSVHVLALQLARRQAWADPLSRELTVISRYIRDRYREAAVLRRAATAASETEPAWPVLARAARAEVEAWRVEHALDEALA